jgi:hypothetical protein
MIHLIRKWWWTSDRALLGMHHGRLLSTFAKRPSLGKANRHRNSLVAEDREPDVRIPVKVERFRSDVLSGDAEITRPNDCESLATDKASRNLLLVIRRSY